MNRDDDLLFARSNRDPRPRTVWGIMANCVQWMGLTLLVAAAAAYWSWPIWQIIPPVLLLTFGWSMVILGATRLESPPNVDLEES